MKQSIDNVEMLQLLEKKQKLLLGIKVAITLDRIRCGRAVRILLFSRSCSDLLIHDIFRCLLIACKLICEIAASTCHGT